jgi:hypothetical protein
MVINRFSAKKNIFFYIITMPEVRARNLNNLTMKYLTLNPVNGTSSSEFSYRGGLPLIRFDLASSDVPMLMDGKNLRINGRLTARTTAGNKLNPLQNNYLDNYAGAFAHCVQNVVVSSKRLNQTLERVSQYSRVVPSIVSQLNNNKYIDTALAIGGIHAGTIPQMRHNLNAYHEYDVNGNTIADANQTGVNFSAPLYCGIFQSGEDLDLSGQTGIGGCTIEILLQPDASVVFGSDANNTATYTLSDLTLTCPVYVMEGENDYAGNVNQYKFNSWSNMFQTLNSSTSVVAFTPGLNSVTSVLQNFVTATDLGDQRFNNCRLGSVGEIRNCRFSKNGSLFPLQFRLQSVAQNNNEQARPLPAQPNSGHVYSVDTEWLRYGLEGVGAKRFARIKNTAREYTGWSAGSVDKDQNAGRTGDTPGSAFTQAILFDAFGGGTDFSQQVFSFELVTSADNRAIRGYDANAGTILPAGGLANNIDGSSATAQACFLYFLNQNTISYSPQGINISR